MKEPIGIKGLLSLLIVCFVLLVVAMWLSTWEDPCYQNTINKTWHPVGCHLPAP